MRLFGLEAFFGSRTPDPRPATRSRHPRCAAQPRGADSDGPPAHDPAPEPRAHRGRRHGRGDRGISGRLVGTMQAHLAAVPPPFRGATSSGSRPTRPGRRCISSVRRCGRCWRPATGSRSSSSTTRRSPSRWREARRLGAELALGGPLTPDQIVYAGSSPLVVRRPRTLRRTSLVDAEERENGRAVRNGRRGADHRPLVPGLGLFAAGDSYAQADTARQVYLDDRRLRRTRTAWAASARSPMRSGASSSAGRPRRIAEGLPPAGRSPGVPEGSLSW